MNVFDILGPMVIGPSSSHTTGAARIGRITLALLGAPAVKIDIFLYGSFAKTYKGHGTDKAPVAGIMGIATDDSRIRRVPKLTRGQGLEVSITTGKIDGAHPSTAEVTLTDVTGNTVSLLGSNIGDGNILVKEVNDVEVSITGQHTTLIMLHRDTPNAIAAVTGVITGAGVNTCNFHLSGQSWDGEAMMTIEIDGSFGPELNEKIKVLPNILSSTMLQPAQLMKPIVTGGIIFMKPEFNYSSVASIVAAAEKSDLPISAIVLRRQAEQMEQTREPVYEHIRKNCQVMTECIDPGCNRDLESTSELTGGSAYKVRRISENGKSLTDSFLSDALCRALVVSELNATVGRIVTALTTGGCGILPAALLTMQAEKQIPGKGCIISLSTTSAVGMVIANNASLAGTQSGCQAECNSAAAVTAAAIVELAGGTPKMAGHAIAIAVKNVLGLVCDPVTGLVEIPCIGRNASGVAGAFVAAEPTLAGIESAIPADEVIWTMKKVGNAMSSTLKETAEGGLAATPTGGRLHKQIFGTVQEPENGHSGCGKYSS